MSIKKKLTGKAFDAVCGMLPKVTPAGVILGGYYMAMYWGKLHRDTVEKHYNHNSKAWKLRSDEVESKAADGKSYLEYQARLGEAGGKVPIWFGEKREGKKKVPYFANYNSCEAIAVYNLCKYFDGDAAPDFPEWVRRFETSGIAIGGMIGSAPSAMKKYLKESGKETESIVGKDYEEADVEEFSGRFDGFLVNLYNNRETAKSGIHTMCITKFGGSNNTRYLIHNDYGTYGKRSFASLKEAVDSYNEGRGGVIELIGVKERV